MEEERLLTWREWTLFGIKWLLLGLFALSLYLTTAQRGASDPAAGLMPALAIGVLANFVLALVLLVPSLRFAISPVIAAGDFAIAAAFVAASQGDPLLLLAVVGALMISGALSLNAVWSAVHAVGLLVALVVGLIYALGSEQALALIAQDLPVPLLMLIGLVVVTIAASYVSDRQVGAQQRRIVQLARRETDELVHMHERTRALYELSSTMSSSLSYERVLDAALDAGRLGLKGDPRDEVVSAVLLFRATDNALHVAASRRFTRSDDATVVNGADGMIAKALRDGAPVIGETPMKDPEVQYFSAFNYCRSVLCVPLRANFDSFGVLLYGSGQKNAFDSEHADLLTAIGHQATMALQNAVLYNSLLDEKERIIDVEEDARKQLARDLHDGPTQSVAAIAMRMSIISKLLERDPAQVKDELKKVEEIARNTVKEIRHMLFTLRPLVLESQGLTAALNQLAEKMQETFGQRVAVRVGKDVEKLLNSQQQGIVFYIIEEAVNNARKHAQADLIKVAIARQGDTMVCQVADNGVGFNLGAVDENYDRRGSLGMVNMRERAALIEAVIRIESTEGKGTSITTAIPLKGAVAAPEPVAAKNGAGTTRLMLAAAERLQQRNR